MTPNTNPHPLDYGGSPLHTYCIGTSLKDRDHDRHPAGIPVREPGQCLYCDEFAEEYLTDEKPTGLVPVEHATAEVES